VTTDKSGQQFGFFTAVDMNVAVFWDIAPSMNPISQAKNQLATGG
jgi:hypothetical protein